jgi:hypothetical protein
MPTARPELPSPPVVALAGWLVPGGGYWLLGQRARAVTVGLTVTAIFVLGLLIGGVRVLQVPLYDDRGQPNGNRLLSEIAAKPWSITQILNGPLGVAGGAASVWASREVRTPGRQYGTGEPRGAKSYSRVNDIAVLYTAVAGMLNLLAIIDAAYRATHPDPQTQAAAAAAPGEAGTVTR